MDMREIMDIMLYPIDFGMLAISCPTCNRECTSVAVALTTLEDPEVESDDGLPAMEQMGIVAYPCSHIFCSACLTDKVARILNAREKNALRLGMFYNLVECKEHGVEYPDQS